MEITTVDPGFSMKKIRVLFVMLQLDAGGSERVVLDLACNLDPLRFEIYIATFHSGVLEQAFKEVSRKIFFIKKKRGFDIFAMIYLFNLVRKHKIDVINAHHFTPCFYSFFGAIINRKKLVYTEHSVPEVEEVAPLIYGKIFNAMLFQIHAVVGVSIEITEKFKYFYPRHRHKFLPILNGVDVQRYSSGGNRDEVRSRWGLQPANFIVGTVANFRKIKNHACLIRAVVRLKEAYPQLHVLLTGTGFPDDAENSEPEIRELIKNSDLQKRVQFTGYQENIPEILLALDLFCLPSFSEGLPVSILEAMAAGVPVVGSQVRGIKEVVDDRKTGLLFISNDDADLADKIEELMNFPDFSKNLANQAFKQVLKKHSKQSWIDNVSRLFLETDLP